MKSAGSEGAAKRVWAVAGAGGVTAFELCLHRLRKAKHMTFPNRQILPSNLQDMLKAATGGKGVELSEAEFMKFMTEAWVW